MRKKNSNILTKEQCGEIALQYPNKNQLYLNNKDVYNKILTNKWLELFDHMPINTSNSAYHWSYDKCKETVLTCKTIKELRTKYISCYNRILKSRWIELLNFLERNGNKYKRMIYVYIFSDNHCYVGLTFNENDRKNRHEREGSVFDHIQKTNLIPEYIKLTDYVDSNEAIKLEKFYIKKYESAKFIMLNVSNGGALGGNSRKWFKENTYEESLLYKTVGDFQKGNSGAYKAAVRNGWIDEFYPDRKIIKKFIEYNYEEAKKEASLYKNISSFEKNSRSAYTSSKNNGWLEEFFPNKPIIHTWDYDSIKKVIEDNNYKFKSELRKNYVGAYDKALKLGIIHEFFSENLPFIIARKIWSFDELEKLIIENNYNRTLFQKKNKSGFRTAKENGWLDLLIPLKK